MNMAVSKLDKKQLELQAQNAALASQVSSAASSRADRAGRPHARSRSGPATDTSYLDLARK